MFKKLLIANRGEIACRIIRTARRMGIKTVAIASEADVMSPHASLADEVVMIGPAPAVQSYLVIEKIIEACKRTGAEAVHPGYGFLSERSAFVRSLSDAGLIFVGPHADAIDALGDKIRSKEVAMKAGVKVVPGAIMALNNPREAEEVVANIGYPVLIKASAGGGGKGMRLVRQPAELEEALTRATSEAVASFGDGRVFIEKYIENPRHIEIQVLGDKHGHVVHLGERECSVQRRHQKILEEAPSPLLDEATRAAMGAEAVALAKAVGYDSAGTVEFVVDQEKNYYFLEMNTRLQVEHPVTEMVTGLDLVEWMLRIAAGEPLTCTQNDISLRGHAIEARLCAEDPERNYLPSTGRLQIYQKLSVASLEGASIRIDDGIEEGGEISVYYDSLIAKVIAHAPSRMQANEALRQALDRMAIQGLKTNLTFLTDILGTTRWQSGQLSTAMLEQVYPQGYRTQEPSTDVRRAMVAAALDAYHLLQQRRHLSKSGGAGPVVVQTAGKTYQADVVGSRARGVKALIFGGKREVNMTVHSTWLPGDPLWEGRIDSKPYVFRMAITPLGFHVGWRGYATEINVLSAAEHEARSKMPKRKPKATNDRVTSPMPGVIRRVDIKPGQKVAAGDPLFVVEAMKMENVLQAERDVTIKDVLVREGDTVPVDAILAIFEKDQEG